MDVGKKKPKTPERKDVGGKKPKTPTRKDKGNKKPKTPTRKNNGNVDELEDRQKETEKDKDQTTASSKNINEIEELESCEKRQKKSVAVPLLDDNDDDDLMLMDDEDRDKDFEPWDDELDDDEYPVPNDDDDDDFQEPAPRARKPIKKETKQKHSTQRRVDKSNRKDDITDIDDETLSLFQRIVGDNFEVKASQEFEEESTEKKDRCINPVEAAGFHATMKTLAYELKKAVKKGKQIKETYSDMIESTIRIAKAMKYPSASNVKKEDIVASIKDINCHAWRQHLQGKQTMGPDDLARGDDEEQLNDDLVIQGPMLGTEETEAAAEAIENLPKMLVADTKKKMRKLFDNITKAHQHAAEASRTLRELHDDLPLNVFLCIADCAIRPLVILHIPKTEATIQRLKEAAVESM